MKHEFSDRFFKNNWIPNLMKIHSLGAKFFHADREMDGHNENTRLFSQFCESTKKDVGKCWWWNQNTQVEDDDDDDYDDYDDDNNNNNKFVYVLTQHPNEQLCSST